MKKLLKISTITLGVIVVVFAVATTLLIAFVNPNNYKNQISQLVMNKTGRELTINGDLHWSFLPFGIQANNIQLNNPPGFETTIFAAAKKMTINIKLSTLLTGHLEVSKIHFNELILNLIKNKSGKTNWDDLAKKNDEKTSTTTTQQTSSDHMPIVNVQLENSVVNWINQQSQQKMTLTDVDFNAKNIKFKKEFPISAQFEIISNKPNVNAKINIKTDVFLNPNKKTYLFNDLKINGYLIDKKYLDNQLPIALSSQVAIDLNHQLMKINDLSFKLANLSGKGNFSGKQLNQSPRFQGNVTVDTFNLKNLMQALGKPLSTEDSDALTSVAMNATIETTPNVITINPFQIQLDKTTLTGNANLQGSKTQLLTFALKGNELDLNPYMSKSSDKENIAKNEQQEKNMSSNSTSADPMKLSGSIQLNQLKFSKTTLNNVNMKITSSDNIMRVSPITAELYQGTLNGNITIDKRNGTPRYTINQLFNNIDVYQLLKQQTESEKLTGTANVLMNITASGNQSDEILRSINGNVKLTVRNGALQGIDLLYQLRRAYAFIKRQPNPSESRLKETQFTELSASGIITNGILSNNDLNLTSEDLTATGNGTANFTNKTVDFRIKTAARGSLIDRNSQFGPDAKQLEIPIKITGTFSDLKPNVDLGYIAKTFYQQQVKQKIIEPLGEKVTQKLKDTLNINDKLNVKNLFSH